MNKEEAVIFSLNQVQPDIANIIKAKNSKGSKINLKELISILSKPNYNLAKEMTASVSSVNRFTKDVFPDKGNEKLCTYLFNRCGLKYCAKCQQVITIDMFKADYCISCNIDYFKEYMPDYYQRNKGRYALDRAERTEHIKRATPLWADKLKIKEIYQNCPEGHEVDHIIPLRGKNVCGLHVENNLQYLTKEENRSKSNKF